jgi:predicted secreted hydrolase
MMSRSLCMILLMLVGTATYAQEFARPSYRLSFPRDHGAHESFETEWWYWTGHLFTENSVPFRDLPAFGFQLTFFRRRGEGDDRWTNAYLAHGAISDHTRSKYVHESRFARGGLNIAGALSPLLRVWHGSWSAKLVGHTQLLEYTLEREGLSVSLIAESPSAPVLHGDHGYSRKGACERCASHYYSYPSLEVRGEILRGEEVIPVRGLGWMDHEFMSSALDKDQVGWDWFSLMTKEGKRVMLFVVRGQHTSANFLSGTLVDGAGVRSLTGADFSLTVLDHWTSPETNTKYPSKWRIVVPSAGIDQVVVPLTAAQEFAGRSTPGGSVYWEGAVASDDRSLLGYVELTGYKERVST